MRATCKTCGNCPTCSGLMCGGHEERSVFCLRIALAKEQAAHAETKAEAAKLREALARIDSLAEEEIGGRNPWRVVSGMGNIARAALAAQGAPPLQSTETHESHLRTLAAVGRWPEESLQWAFVAGGKWWQFHANGATAFPSEVDEMEAEAVRRYGEPIAQGAPSAQEKPSWIVNDLGELGVMCSGRAYFLYKGRSLEYGEDSRDGVAHHDNGEPMKYRAVGKREFGEVCYPFAFTVRDLPVNQPYTEELIGDSPDSRWRPLPAAPAKETRPGDCPHGLSAVQGCPNCTDSRRAPNKGKPQ
jgi:hypothetical protein